MENLPQERLSIAVVAVAACEAVLALTLDYVKERQAFGRPIGSFQHTRFVLAEMATETTIARAYVDECIARAHAPGADRPGRGDGEVVDDRPAEQGRRRGACSCTAGTAT